MEEESTKIISNNKKSKIILLGKRSNLSTNLHKRIPHSIVCSSGEFSNMQGNFYKHLINSELRIIINSFFPACHITNKEYSLEEKKSLALNPIKEIFQIIEEKGLNVKKIIYTSSSSVYGGLNANENTKIKKLEAPYPSMKFMAEKLVSQYARDKDIDLTIARIFNMYGDKDNFSIVSKILDAYLNNSEITINNFGSSVRDFIHVEDVCKVYKKLLFEQDIPILNIGTGIGVQVSSLLGIFQPFINPQNIAYKEVEEVNSVIADIEKLNKIIVTSNFISILDYMRDKQNERNNLNH